MEYTKLALMNLVDMGHSLKDSFTAYFIMFAKHHNFTPIMAPFSSQKYGPEWFKQEFPPLASNMKLKLLRSRRIFSFQGYYPPKLGT